MGYLKRVGLLSSLLFVGVLGGLMAPLSSEAVPTVTLKVDSGTASSILITTSSTCTATEVTLGYTACYAINTNLTVAGLGAAGGVQRSYNVRNAPGATARLRVADKLGQDKFSLIGVQFIPALANWGSPAANANETHVLTLTMSNPFNSAANLNNTGTYVWALRAGGEFRAGPTTAGACTGFTTTGACNNIQNKVTFPGTGTFNPAIGSKAILSPAGSAANTQPLSFTVAGPTAAIVSFNGLTNTTLGQVNPTYPSFSCDNNGTTAGGACTPTISETMTVTLKGPDSYVLVNGGDSFAANCTAELSAQQQKQIAFLTNLVRFLTVLEQRRPNPRLSAFIDKLEAFLATVNRNQDPDCPGARLVDLDIAVAAAADQVAFLADGAVVGEPAPPDTGTITITKNTGQETSDSFTFNISGPSSSTETISMGGQNSESIVVTVAAGTYNVVESPQSGWNLTQASCGGGNTNGVTVLVGGNVTCTFTNSPATGNDLGIRLTWGAQPSDLDSHLYIPNGYEVAYFAQGSLVASPYADLDLDDTTGFGPENITVVRRMKGTYQYFVHNFSGTFDPGMTGSPARVELIRNGVPTTYVPPASEGTNRYWHVFNVIVNSDCVVSIVPINAWLASPPTPVTQTEELCPVVP